ncbi:hypothetical protein OIU76_002779 [Salix suchowensis]|nr:hypothetical protein OIU76_002779 [Salix suchowensis]
MKVKNSNLPLLILMGIELLLATLRRVPRRLNRWLWIPTDDDRVGVAQEKRQGNRGYYMGSRFTVLQDSNVDNLPINKDASEIEVWFLLQNRSQGNGYKGFGNQEWRLKFPEMAVKVVLRVKFDHHPVLVDLHYKESKNKTSMSFIFEAGWDISDQLTAINLLICDFSNNFSFYHGRIVPGGFYSPSTYQKRQIHSYIVEFMGQKLAS